MDDSLPNDGELFNAFTEPVEQAEERRASISKAQAGKAILDDLLAKVEQDIAEMESVNAISIMPHTDATAFMTAWYGLQERLTYAIEFKNYIESLLMTTKR